MSAVRLARGYTGRARIIRSTAAITATRHPAGRRRVRVWPPCLPSCAGVTEGTAADVLIVRLIDVAAMEAAFCPTRWGGHVDPSQETWAWWRRGQGYLAALRKMVDDYRALLIFDEVISGFRVGRGVPRGFSGCART